MEVLINKKPLRISGSYPENMTRNVTLFFSSSFHLYSFMGHCVPLSFIRYGCQLNVMTFCSRTTGKENYSVML